MTVGKLIVFCGPSGSGKGTVEKKFLHDPEFNFHFSVSATTREAREGEVDGNHYHFLTKQDFEKWIEEDKFLEWAEFINNYYGTPIEPVKKMLQEGKNVFLEIEILGVLQVIKKMPEAVTIFLAPPSIEELEKRLRDRGTETEEVLTNRVNRAKEEIKYADDKSVFKYKVINDQVDTAAEEIKEIIRREIKNV